MTARRDQIIALAGVSQAALWSHQLATRGRYEEQRIRWTVESILCTDPDSAEQVFGGVRDGTVPGIAEGLTLLRTQLGGPPMQMSRSEMALTTRYFGQLLRLAARVQKRATVLDGIAKGIDQVRRTAQLLDENHDSTLNALADIYRENISPVAPRIMIQGNSQYLQNDGYARIIRVFLLGGVRAGILWRQCGGRLWQLLLLRPRLLAETRNF